MNRSKSSLVQFLQYMAGGSLYFLSAYVVFAACYSLFHWHWFWAKAAADAIGWTLNYGVQRFWAFGNQHHLSEIEHLGRYLFIETVGFVLDYLIIAGLVVIGITPYIGFFISAGFFTVWSWAWYKYWVFPDKKTLFHTSPNQSLTIIEPKRTISKDRYIGDYVFATHDRLLAIMYLANKGVANIMNTRSNPPRIIIQDEPQEYLKNDRGGAIYELSKKYFEPTPQTELSEFEQVSRKAIKPLGKEDYDSSIEAMREAGIEVYFVDRKSFDEILSDKNEEAVISRFKPYDN